MTPSSKFGPSSALSCAQCEEQLTDFLDGALGPKEKAAVETHLAACVTCAEFARDAAGAMAFAGRTSAVEVPATLLPRILAEITTGPSRVLVEASWTERVFGRWVRPLLAPRFALGVAMAALSLAIIPWRTSVPGDLTTVPARILTMAENRVYRVFDRTVKGYEDLAVVAQARDRIDEWNSAVKDGSGDAADSTEPSGVRLR